MIFPSIKTFSRQQAITYSLLFILLGSRMCQEIIQCLYSAFENTDQIPTQIEVINKIVPYLAFFDLVLFTFGFIAIAIVTNRDKLHEFNIDKAFIVIFLYAGFLVSRDFFFEMGCLTGLALFLFVYALASYDIKISNGGRVAWLVSGVTICIFIAYFIFATNFLRLYQTENALSFFYSSYLPSVAIYEEAIFRGMLWKYLKDLQLSEEKIVLTQSCFFWLSHIGTLPTAPFFFWLIIPLLSLLLGYIVSRTKSIFPSTVIHLLYNFLVTAG